MRPLTQYILRVSPTPRVCYCLLGGPVATPTPGCAHLRTITRPTNGCPMTMRPRARDGPCCHRSTPPPMSTAHTRYATFGKVGSVALSPVRHPPGVQTSCVYATFHASVSAVARRDGPASDHLAGRVQCISLMISRLGWTFQRQRHLVVWRPRRDSNPQRLNP